MINDANTVLAVLRVIRVHVTRLAAVCVADCFLYQQYPIGCVQQRRVN